MQTHKRKNKPKLFFLYSKRLSEKTLKFVNKKELHASKQPIALVNVNQILKSDQFKHKDTGI